MTEIRICAFCGQKDPRWHGTDAKGWTKTQDGQDRCPDCGWNQAGRPAETDDRRSKLENWRHLMTTWPPDGWDGAGDLIARHAGVVHEIEHQLDAADPAWRDEDLHRYRPRTPDPRAT